MIESVGILRGAGILLLILLAAPDDRDKQFHEKLERTSPRDGKALLDLGAWCEGQDRSSWAERCYRKVLKLGEGAQFAEASYRLARIELERKLYDRAYARLRKLLSGHEHSKARALLERVENASTRKQRELVKQADKLYKKRDYEKARGLYEKAYELYPAQATTAAFVPKKTLLRRLAQSQDRIDDEFYRRKIEPTERSVRDCTRRGCDGGFVECKKCVGSGIITVTKRFLKKRTVVENHSCPQCNKVGHVFCPTCIGLESTTDDEKLTDRERKALGKVIGKVRSSRILNLSLGRALAQVETTILEEEHGPTLNYFRSIKPKYSLSKALRARLATVPPSAVAVQGAASVWKRTRDLRYKANFLLGYTCEFARYIQQFDMLRGSRRAPNFASLPTPSPEDEGIVGPEVLAAFPDDGTTGWVQVKGTLRSFKAKGSFHGRLSIRGAVSHKINFFVWSRAAAGHLDKLARGPWRNRVTGLGRQYPFEIGEKLEDAPAGHNVVVVGRFLRDRLGYPRNWFEVWGVEIGLSQQQEKILQALGESIEISFPGVAVGKIASFLHVWFGVAVEFDGVDQGVMVTCEARGASVGRLLDALAGAMDVEWYFDAGKAIFCRRAPRQEAKDLAAVLGRLASVDRGEVVVRKGGARARTRPSNADPELPTDPGALRDLAAKAMAEMQYSLADKCYKKLSEGAEDKKQGRELKKLRHKVHLFHGLTKNTPISHLVGADDLSRVTVRNPSGKEFQQTVRVLERAADHFVVQSSYGGKAHIKRDRIREDQPLTTREWRSLKKRDLQRQIKGIDGVSGRERLSKLFLTALFSKTNKLETGGTELLEKAITDDGFGWLVETYFPDQSENLTRHWTLATSRSKKKAPSATVKPKKDPPVIVEKAPLAPLPRSDEELYPFARKHYIQGRRYLARALPGMDDAKTMRKRARDHFELGRDAVDRLLAGSPERTDVIKLRHELALSIQTCVRDLGFFD